MSAQGDVAAEQIAVDGLWRRVAVALLVFWATSSMLRVYCVAALTCQFPAFLQTNSSDGRWRDWRGRVRDQHTETGLRVTVTAGVLNGQSVDDQTTSYVIHCVEVLPVGGRHPTSYTVSRLYQ